MRLFATFFGAVCALALSGDSFSGRSFAAELQSPGERILLGAISSRCQSDEEGYRAVSARLRQLGANVETPSMGAAACLGLQCAAHLRGEPGYLMGGQVLKGQSSLWIVDLAKDQVLIQRHVGPGVDKPLSLARQAAALAERLQDPQSAWLPRSRVAVCGEPSGATAQPGSTMAPGAPALDAAKEGLAGAEPRVVLAVHAPRAVSRYAADFQKGVRRSLTEMGLIVREVRGVAPPGNPRDALPDAMQELPLIDVQLLAPPEDKKHATPDGAVVRLSDGRHASQSSIDCAGADCEPQQLVQAVRRNAALLLDRMNEGHISDGRIKSGDGAGESFFMFSAASAPYCLPAEVCSSEAPPPAALSREAVVATEVSTPRSALPPPPASARPYFTSGGLLMGLGVAALTASAALAGIEGHPSNMVCNSAGDAGRGDCVYSNRALFSVGFVLGTGLVIGGGILLWQARRRSVNVTR